MDTLEKYIGLTATAKELIEDLFGYIEDHGEVAPDEVTEAHCDRMAKIVGLLSAAKHLTRK